MTQQWPYILALQPEPVFFLGCLLRHNTYAPPEPRVLRAGTASGEAQRSLITGNASTAYARSSWPPATERHRILQPAPQAYNRQCMRTFLNYLRTTNVDLKFSLWKYAQTITVLMQPLDTQWFTKPGKPTHCSDQTMYISLTCHERNLSILIHNNKQDDDDKSDN